MNPELQKLIEQAKAALARGADPAAVDAKFAEMSQGRFASLRDVLQASGMAEGEAAEAKKIKRESDVLNKSHISNKLRMLFQGGTLRFGDEAIGAAAAAVPGGKGYREARDASRERVSALREATPVASGLMEGLGGLLLPGAGSIASVAKAAPLAKAGILAAEGGAIGGLFGAGDAPEGERLDAAKVPAAVGAATGLVAPAAGALFQSLPRMAGSRNARVAKELVKRSGLVENDINKAIKEADKGIEAVRAKHYGQIELKYPGAIDDPDILKVIQSDAIKEHARAINPVLVGKGGKGGKGGKKPEPGRAPTFKELQSLRDRLRKKDPDLAKQLSDVMSKGINGIDEADAAYANARSTRRAFEIGRGTAKDKKAQLYARSAADTDRILEKMPDDAKLAFRKGRMHEILVKLGKRESDAVPLLKDYMDAGDETKAVLRQVFPDDKSFEGFMAVLAKEKRAAAVAAAFKRYAPLAVVGGGAAAGAAAFAK